MAALGLSLFSIGSTTAFAASDPANNRFDLSDGSIIVSAGTSSGVMVTYGSSSKDNIAFATEIVIFSSSATTNTITVQGSISGTVKITLDNVSLDASATADACAFSIGTGSSVSLTLTGDSTLISGSTQAGVGVPTGSTLIITAASTGKLTVTGQGAGIGGDKGADASSGDGSDGENAGTITINGGTVIATGNGGAGIGGGSGGKGSDGTSAIAGGDGGDGGDGGTVTINGGTVTANGLIDDNRGNTGIGGGHGGRGGNNASSTGYAGDGGDGGSVGYVTINGGTVKATGSGDGANEGAPGIGGGYRGTYGYASPHRGNYGSGDSSGLVTINGGTVTARGGSTDGAGIGGSFACNGCDVTITGGTVTAYGATGAAGIGAGTYAVSGTVTISGGTVFAYGGSGGAGIGGGYGGSGSTVIITGSGTSVTAVAGSGAYDIGGGSNSGGGTLTVGNTSTTTPLPSVTLSNRGTSSSTSFKNCVITNNASVEMTGTYCADGYIPTTVELTAPTEAAVGKAYTLTATISGYSGSGSVQFSYKASGDTSFTSIGSAVTVSAGTASATFAPTAGGEYTVMAAYTSSGAYRKGNDTSGVTVADATLASLGISAGTLSPAFSSTTTDYTVSVAYEIASLTVTPTLHETSSTVKVNGNTVASGNASGGIALAPDATTEINVVVTAQDGTTVVTYTVSVYRAAPFTDSALAGLTIDSGTLTPSFATGTTDYTVDVSKDVESVTVTPTVNETHATVKVNGKTVTSGNASDSIELTPGTTNEISVVVTAQDGVTKTTYTISVYRAASSDASLQSLGCSSGSLDPSFDSGTNEYDIHVSNSVSSMAVTPTVNEAHATVKVNGKKVASGSASGSIALESGGTTEINVVVTAQDGTTTITYKISVTRGPSSDASLSSLNISSGSLSPAFNSATTDYSVIVANDVDSFVVRPVVNEAHATVKVNGKTIASGSVSDEIALTAGAITQINVVVTSQDSTTSITYQINVLRLFSSDASLSKLSVSSGTLNPAFDSGETDYIVYVENSVDSITVTPTVNHASATVTVNGTTVASGSVSDGIVLTAGVPTEIDVVVTAQDGITSRTYKIEATRAESSYTLHFNSQHGTTVSDKSVAYNQQIGALPVPSRDGYTFRGWYTSPYGQGEKWTSTTVYGLLTDTTLYAKWTANAESSTASSSTSPTATASPAASPSATATAVPAASAMATPATGSSSTPDATVALTILPGEVSEDENTGIITIVIDTDDLPEGTASVQLPDGRVVDVSGGGTITLEITDEDLDKNGMARITPLDEEGTPLGNLSVQVHNESGFSIVAIVLLSLGVLLIVGFVLFVVIRRKKRDQDR